MTYTATNAYNKVDKIIRVAGWVIEQVNSCFFVSGEGCTSVCTLRSFRCNSSHLCRKEMFTFSYPADASARSCTVLLSFFLFLSFFFLSLTCSIRHFVQNNILLNSYIISFSGFRIRRSKLILNSRNHTPHSLYKA